MIRTIHFMALVFASALGVLVAATTARGMVITHGSTSVEIEFVTIGDPGNAADASSFTGDYGDVDYVYDIGKYEISVNQWDAAMGEAPLNGHTYASDQPGNVRLYEAARFCNWLTSGDPTQGVYTIGGLPTMTAIDRATALASYDQIFVLPTNDEWHKAAYYDPATGTYRKHPTGAARPTAVTGGTAANTAVYTFSGEANPTGPADIDNAGGLSLYGTMGQAGNMSEWIEGVVPDSQTPAYWRGGVFGGSDYLFRNTTTQLSASSGWSQNGFRVVRIEAPTPPAAGAVPEPVSAALVVAGSVLIGLRRRRC